MAQQPIDSAMQSIVRFHQGLIGWKTEAVHRRKYGDFSLDLEDLHSSPDFVSKATADKLLNLSEPQFSPL